jgi:hypothetical protein
VEYRFVGQKDFKPVTSLTINQSKTFNPAACPPLCQYPLALKFGVPSDGPPSFHGNRGRSLCAAQSPIRIRVSARDLDGATVSLVQEFVNDAVSVEGPEDNDAVFVYADNVVSEDRSCVHCKVTNEPDNMKVSVGSSSLSDTALRKLAGEACAKKISELPIDDFSCSSSYYKYSAVALVDLSCQRVWAIKVDMERTDCESSGSGLMVVPLYGKTDPARPVSITVPPQKGESKEGESKSSGAGANADDSFDDLPSGFVRKQRASAPSSMEQMQHSLQNLEAQIQRIADAIKK